MPMLGQQLGTEGVVYDTNTIGGVVRPAGDPAQTPTIGTTQVVTALIPDFTQQHSPGTLQVGESLRDYTEGQDWFCRRIVGKLPISCAAFDTTVTADDAWPTVMVTAGIFVARASSSDPGLPDSSQLELDPQALQNIQQPWIWRRTWWLGAAQVPASSRGSSPPQWSAMLPNSNQEFGSLGDGPNVDAKTMRRIKRFERLWFSISAFGWLPGYSLATTEDENQPLVYWSADLRVLGAMRRAHNRSTFG